MFHALAGLGNKSTNDVFYGDKRIEGRISDDISTFGFRPNEAA